MSSLKKSIAIINDISKNSNNFIDSLVSNIHNPKQIVLDLNTCSCCEKHQIDRPTYLRYWNDTDFNNKQLQESDCKCPCRHYARFICRAFKTIDDELIYSGNCGRSQCEFRCNCN